ncbi:MAG TPA: hypothetical protein VGE51_09275 [Fontimonas sp.]
MPQRTLTLLEAVQQRMRTIRQGDIAQLIVDGGGAMVATSLEVAQAGKWAQRKPSTGNVMTDRSRYFEQITVMISRQGSMFPTRGHHAAIEKLAKQMMQAGYDINEWALPPELRGLGRHAALDAKPADKTDKADPAKDASEAS